MLRILFSSILFSAMGMMQKSQLMGNHRLMQSVENSTVQNPFSDTPSAEIPYQNSTNQTAPQDNAVILPISIGDDYQQYWSDFIDTSKDKTMVPVKYFKFTIDKLYPDQDLFILMKAVADHSQYPTLVLSDVNQHPSIYDPQDTICGTHGLGICSIAPEKIKLDQTYYMTVYCLETCQFGIKVSYQEEQVVELGDSTVLNFVQTEQRLLKVHVPAKMVNLDRIIIRAHIVQGSQLKEAFYFYVNNGNENPSPVKHDYRGEEIWVTGKGIVVHNNTENTVKADQNYTIVISASANTTIYLRSDYFGALRTVYLYQIVDDIVGPGEVNTYKLSIGNYYRRVLAKKDLSLDMNPYEGNPDLFVTPAPLPDTLDEYLWQSQLDLGYEGMTISPKNLNQVEGEDIEVYLSVRGVQEVSSYSFMFYVSDKYNRILSTLSTETGFLAEHEHIHYNLDLSNEKSQYYRIQASFPEGKSVLLLKRCILNPDQADDNQFEQILDLLTADSNNFYNCHFEPSEFEPYLNSPVTTSSTEVLPLTRNATLMVSSGSLQFYYDSQVCTDGVKNVDVAEFEGIPTRCKYILAIVSTSSEQTHFVLTLKGEDSHQILTPGTPVMSHLMQKDRDYFTYRVRDDHVIDLTFQFTVLNGDIIVWGSASTPFPNATHHDVSAIYNLDVINFRAESLTKPLKGDFYLTVEAESVSTYTVILITGQAMVDQSEEPAQQAPVRPNYVLLNDGIPQEITSHQLSASMYFAFKVHHEESSNSSIYINLDAIVGSCKAYIIAFPENTPVHLRKHPTQDTYLWAVTSSQRSLAIPSDDPAFVNNGEYRIMVVPIDDEVVYEIQYSSATTITQLKVGQPHFDIVAQGQLRYYELKFNPAVKELSITRTITSSDLLPSDDVQVYVSMTQLHPSNQANDAAIRGQNNTVLKLGFKELNVTTCKQEECTLYLAAKSFGRSNEFTLLARVFNDPVELLESVSQIVQSPVKDTLEEAYFFYRIPKNSPVRIQTYSIYQDLDLYGIVESFATVRKFLNKLQNKQDFSEKQITKAQRKVIEHFPTVNNYQFTSINNTSFGSTVMIANELDLNTQPCQQESYGCVMLITAALDKTSYMYNYSSFSDGTFEIEASSDVETIHIGEPTVGFTQGGIFEYYKLVVRSPVKMIEIALSPLDDGDPDLYVKYQDSDVPRWPTTMDYDFHSISYKSDVLLIQSHDPFFAEKPVQATYIIGVMGFVKTRFTIEVNLVDLQYYTLTAGVIKDKVVLHSNLNDGTDDDYGHIAFFKYNHMYNSTFRVVVSKQSGSLAIGVNRHGNTSFWQMQTQSVLPSLPYYNKTDPTWKAKFSDRLFGGILNISVGSKGFCTMCTYLIAVKNKNNQPNEISIVVGVDGQALMLGGGQAIFDSATKEGNHYQYSVEEGSVDFQVEVFGGKVNIYAGPYMSLLLSNYTIKIEKVSGTKVVPIRGLQNNSRIYLRIESVGKRANYSIMALTANDSIRHIELEKSESGTIEANAIATFYYISQGKDLPCTLFIQYARTTRGFMHPRLDVEFVSNENKGQTGSFLQVPTDQLESPTHMQATFELRNADGFYRITLENENPYTVEYVLVLNSNNVDLVLPDQAILERSIINGPPRTFEVFLRESEWLYLEVFQCLGQVAVSFEQGEQKSRLPMQEVYTIQQIGQSNDVSFLVTPQDGLLHETGREALFMVVPHVLTSGTKFPSDIYFQGAGGNIDVFLVNLDLMVQFKSLGCTQNNCSIPQTPSYISYTLHVTNNQAYMPAFGGCDLQLDQVKDYHFDEPSGELYHQKYFRLSKNVTDTLADLTIELKAADLNQESDYFVQVLAHVYFDTTLEPFTFQYKQNSFNIQALYDQAGIGSSSTSESEQSTSFESEQSISSESEQQTASSESTSSSLKSSKSQQSSHSTKTSNQKTSASASATASASHSAVKTVQKTSQSNKLFGYDLKLIGEGAALLFLGVAAIFLLYKCCYLKFRKSHLKDARTRVKQDEEEGQ